MWSLEPVNINDCIFDSCYSTGENFKIIDNYSDKYPSVLIHEFLGFKTTSIETNMCTLSAVNCQENKEPKKKFGAYIHLHANTFRIDFFNCTNKEKVDSSQVIFTQSHKQASYVNYVYSTGQAGYSFIEIKDIQSTDQLTFQYFNIYNSTLFTEDVVTENGTTSVVEENYGIIDFGGDYAGSVVFIFCHIYNIETDNKFYKPVLSFSSNGRHPIFANCYSNVDSIVDNQGFSFGTPFQPTTFTEISNISKTTMLVPSNSPSYSPSEVVENENVKRNNVNNIVVVAVSIVVPAIFTIVGLVVTRKIAERKIIFVDEDDDVFYRRKEVTDLINNDDNDNNNNNAEEIYND